MRREGTGQLVSPQEADAVGLMTGSVQEKAVSHYPMHRS